MADTFRFDVFLSHSAKDRQVVRALANRLRLADLQVWFQPSSAERTKPVDKQIEDALEQSRVLVLCVSAHAVGADWTRLQAESSRFRDPLNPSRRLICLQLDGTSQPDIPKQCPVVAWPRSNRDLAFVQLLEEIRRSADLLPSHNVGLRLQRAERAWDAGGKWTTTEMAFSPRGKQAIVVGSAVVRLWDFERSRHVLSLRGHEYPVGALAWSADEQYVLSGDDDGEVRLWNLALERIVYVLRGHQEPIQDLAFSPDQRYALSSSRDKTMRLWDLRSGQSLRSFEGHHDAVRAMVWSVDGQRAISSSDDGSIRIWDINTGDVLCVLHMDRGYVRSVKWTADESRAISGDGDGAVRVWDLKTQRCLRVLEGHEGAIMDVALSPDERHIASGDHHGTVRLWEIETGRCVRILKGRSDAILFGLQWTSDGRRLFAGDYEGAIRSWDLSDLATPLGIQTGVATVSHTPDDVQYMNAKVVLVGDTNAGKTGLAHRLATGKWRPSEDSTVGAWSTQWSLRDGGADAGVEREIWLWDFGGQADQRLIHQLYLDRAALILLLFNADQEDVLPGLRDWQTALRRCLDGTAHEFLVAGRVDTGFKASRGKLQAFAKEQGLSYFETSAKSGEGCDDLRAAVVEGIPWSQMETRTSPRIFKLIKEEILKLRDDQQVLHTFKELRELLWQRLPQESRFSDDTLRAVIRLLDGPGIVKELEYGTYVLLAPEWINAYAQAVIRTLRSVENELGVLPLRSIADGKLIYQSIGRDGAPVEVKRLPPAEERVVLGEMERQLELRGLCLRQGDKLVFPSHCGRDRPALTQHPSVFISYSVKGYLDDIYATLVVKLADSQSFELRELWRDAADFVTLVGEHHMGITLRRDSGSEGQISVYFGESVALQDQVIFANYIHSHLSGASEHARRLRHYVCPHCHVPKGNAEVLMSKLLLKKQEADTECDNCGRRFPLWDALEKKFASDAVRQQVEELEAVDELKLSERRKGKLLVLNVGACITSANQKWFEIPQDEDDGIDMMVEFTDADGNGLGKGLCLQLKAGNSHLTRRKDGSEFFTIKKQRWIKTWMNQPYPVMLVIGTFSTPDERTPHKEKVAFADIRWMEITSVLARESQHGTKPVKRVEFKGERLDLTSVRRWRDKLLSATSS